ncbi:MAG TPA: SH3 domain-containing protein [Roseiflexaceae bacterium]|nr:SH3 domain-containing protein [Roseiflexaceae bacterium]
MLRLTRSLCLLLVPLALGACGQVAQTHLGTPVVVIQTAPPITSPPLIPPTQPTITPTATVAPTALPQLRVDRAVNLRSGPSTAFAIIRTLPVDTLVELQSRRDSNGDRWYEVRAGDDIGWVSGAIVQVEAAQAAALPASGE